MLRALVTDDPTLATAVLRELLARFPAKAAALCGEAEVPLPPGQWWRDQRLEPPRWP